MKRSALAMRDEFELAYRSRTPLLKELSKTLEGEVRDTLRGVRNIDRIYFRVKTEDSFITKAADPSTDPPYSNPLLEIEDQVGGRILVFFLQDLEDVAGRLRGTFNTVERAHRRPGKDEEFGYESLHLICMIPPHLVPSTWSSQEDMPTTFELQVRTLFMHAWAEPQHDLAYKSSKDLPSDARREIAWVAASAWGADRALARVREQLEGGPS